MGLICRPPVCNGSYSSSDINIQPLQVRATIGDNVPYCDYLKSKHDNEVTRLQDQLEKAKIEVEKYKKQFKGEQII